MISSSTNGWRLLHILALFPALFAISAFETASGRSSADWEAIADSLIAVQELDSAAAALREAYGLDEGNAAILRKLAKVCMSLGDLASARQALDLVVEMDRRDVDSYLEIARINWLIGSFNLAMQYIDLAEIAEAGPNDKIPAYRSIVYRGMDMPAQAESVLVAAQKKFPDSPLILSNLGLVVALAGDYETGLRHTRRAYDLDSTDPSIMTSLAGLYLAEANREEARRLYEKALEIDPLNYFVRQSLQDFDHLALEARLHRLMSDGIRFFERSLYSKARGAFSEAIELDSTLFEAYLNLGFTLNLLGEPRNAIRTFGTAERLDSASAALYIGWGNALAGIGEYDGAARSYEKALALDPTLTDIREALQTVRRLGEGNRNEE